MRDNRCPAPGLLVAALLISPLAAAQLPSAGRVPPLEPQPDEVVLDLKSLQTAQTDEADTGSPGIRLRMTASAARDANSAWWIESVLHILPGQISFTDEPPDCRLARLKWRVAVESPEEDAPKPQVIDFQAAELRLCGAPAEDATRYGLVYNLSHRVPGPGVYDLRVEIEDTLDSNLRSGSIGRRVRVPDVTATAFALSGIAMQHYGTPPPAAAQVQTGNANIKASYRVPSDNDSVFHPGDVIAFDMRVFRSSRMQGKTIDLQLTVSGNGAVVYTEPIPASGDRVHGVYHIDANARPGNYRLGICAGSGGQWIDFEIVTGTHSPPFASLVGDPPQPEASPLPSTLTPPQSLSAEERMALLTRVRDHMRDAALRTPSFTCTEEILRSTFARIPRRLLSMDRARLEVAVADGKELFSWPGEAHFEKDDPSQIVRGGMTTTGDYAYFTRQVFGSNDVLYSRGIDQELLGHAAVRYDYRIDSPVYEIRWGPRSANSTFHGSFWVDKTTEDVLALAGMVTDLPAGFPVSGITSVLAFRPVLMNGRNYPFPSTAQVTARLRGEEEVQNQIAFRNCRQFSGESRIIFTDDSTAAAAPAAQSETRAFSLNAGLTLDLTLDQAIAGQSAAAGDRISATLKNPVKFGNSVIPAGIHVMGRLLQVEFDFETSQIRAVIEFQRVEYNGTTLVFRARFHSAGKSQGLRWEPSKIAPYGAALRLTEGATVIPAGLLTKWETVAMR